MRPRHRFLALVLHLVFAVQVVADMEGPWCPMAMPVAPMPATSAATGPSDEGARHAAHAVHAVHAVHAPHVGHGAHATHAAHGTHAADDGTATAPEPSPRPTAPQGDDHCVLGATCAPVALAAVAAVHTAAGLRVVDTPSPHHRDARPASRRTQPDTPPPRA
jgi:hypothetical protein